MTSARRINLIEEAKPVERAVLVAESYEHLGIGFLYVGLDPADPYGSFKKLPSAVEFRDRVYGRSGFDSDRNIAVYRTDVPIARAIRKAELA